MAAATCSNTSISSGIASYIVVDYNLTQEIMTVKEEGFIISTIWVKAHQDNKTAVKILFFDAQLNVQADKDVSMFHQSIPDYL
eukprot:2060721-Ditylum_brightwellii.AAC.1